MAQVEITDEMVERAAKALHAYWWRGDRSAWPDVAEEDRTMAEGHARVVLDAALNGEGSS
jgi:hypothetical protein